MNGEKQISSARAPSRQNGSTDQAPAFHLSGAGPWGDLEDPQEEYGCSGSGGQSQMIYQLVLEGQCGALWVV